MIGIVIFGCVVSGATCLQAFHSSTTQEKTTQSSQQTPPIQHIPAPPSSGVPPPPTDGRGLVGSDSKQLSPVESYLPEGSTIATFPISETQMRAAVASVDLDRDGTPEIVAVFNASKPDEGLFVGVVARDGDRIVLRSPIRLPGTYIQNNIYDRLFISFAVRDVTGDGIPEVLVTSAQGASLGAQLQIFSFDGQALQLMADIDGDVIQLIERGAGRPAVIKARYKDSPTGRSFEWRDGKFEEVR